MNRKKGFTLLELLIVVGILAILAAVLIMVLNPAETLRKSRDSQRMSDLSTIKSALSLYMSNTATPYMAYDGGSFNNNSCKATTTASWAAGDRIYYSYTGTISDLYVDGSNAVPVTVSISNVGKVDGYGWIPVNLASLTDGTPISNFPVDPVNTIGNAGAVASTDLVYRYACAASPLSFELNATLESSAYTSADNKPAKDGGDNSSLYEVGTELRILDSGTDF